MRNHSSTSLMNQWNLDYKTLQVNDDEKDKHSSTKHTEIWIIRTSKGLVQSIGF